MPCQFVILVSVLWLLDVDPYSVEFSTHDSLERNRKLKMTTELDRSKSNGCTKELGISHAAHTKIDHAN